MKISSNKSTVFLRSIVVVTFFLLTTAFLLQPVYASNNLKVIGTDVGLEVVPLDTNLFNELNLNPGDTVSSNLTIKNNYTNNFDLYLRTERLGEAPLGGQPDLYNQLLMTVNLREKVIYSGPMNGFGNKNINLGSFKSGDTEDMNVQVSLPGKSTGNTFMATTLTNKWTLTAQVKNIEEEILPPNLPKTGGAGTIYFFAAGGLMLLIGLYMRKKIYK